MMLDRFNIGLLAFMLAFFPASAGAQSPIRNFPPGVFQNRTAIDGGSGVSFAIQFPTYTAANNENTTSQTTYTFTSVAIITGANHCIPIAIGIRTGSTVSRPTVTIDPGGGAQTASFVAERGAGSDTYSAIFQVTSPITSGSTATIVVSGFGSAAVRAGVATYSVTSSSCAAPTGAALANSGAANPSGTVTVPSGGGVIMTELQATTVSSSITAPASGPVQDHSAILGASTTLFMTGSDVTHSGSTTYTITNTVSPSGSSAVFVAYGP